VKRRIVEMVLLAIGVAILVALAGGTTERRVSTYSSYESGPNGYLLLFNVLAREDVHVVRSGVPFAQIDPRVRVLAFTSVEPDYGRGDIVVLDKNDRRALQTFLGRGGRIVYFTENGRDSLGLGRKPALPFTRLDVTRFTNAALAAHPQQALAAYDALAGHGPVAFEERVHGFGEDRSMWSVLPQSVRIAFWLTLAAIVLALIDANVRFAPPLPVEPRDDRDSSAYIVSMAELLRRARAGSASIARFARAFPKNADLARLASISEPNDDALLRAARLYHQLRKDRQ
jgi:hypothetical protein